MAETTTFEAPAFTARGTKRDAVRLPEATFDGIVHMPVMHQAVKAFLANQRQGNASTKTRGFVIGGNQKPWKQKGTGRARQGSTRAPHWVGGGTVFGPTPRAYDQYVPRQVRQLARRSAFNARARENSVMVIDRFEYDAPHTKTLLRLLERLGVADQKVLILTDGVKPNVWLSGRNLPTAHVMPYSDASTYHILWSDVVLIEAGAIGQELAPVTESDPAEDEPRAKKVKAAREPRAEKAAAKKTTKTAAKKATRTAAKKKTASKTKSASKSAGAKKKTTKTVAKKKSGTKSGAKKKGKE
jgi:large subunit ribosomal protein L4